MSRPRIAVVAAVIERDDGSFLLAQRPSGKVYEGYWEFPGGKVEPGESPEAALIRELHEELGILVQDCFPWIAQEFDYAHADVRLLFYRVTAWSGEIEGRERQLFAWQHLDRLTVGPLLPANGPVLRALGLPLVYGIADFDESEFHYAQQRVEPALRSGLRLMQIRSKQLPVAARRKHAAELLSLARRYGARVLLNGDAVLADSLGADGLHWTGRQLSAAALRAPFSLVAASCHSIEDVYRAEQLQLDFVVLGPVAPTATHPHAQPLGWDAFEQIARHARLPVYALGGLRPSDLLTARRRGAHGIAMIRGAWG